MKICILDIPIITVIGFILAVIYARIFAKRNPDFYYWGGLITVILVWINVLLYNTGLITPWLLGLSMVKTNGWVSLFYMLSYPLWFMWGGERGFQIFGRSPDQGGFIWLSTLKDRTKPFSPSWE